MTDFMMRWTRLAATGALLGSLAAGAAQATDWDKLQAGTGWSGSGEAPAAAGTPDEGAGSMSAVEATAAGGDPGAAIVSAFTTLGMKPARAQCYGKVLTGQLSPDDQQKAVEIVSNASDGKAVRIAVLNAGPDLVGGFTAADTRCPESMGG